MDTTNWNEAIAAWQAILGERAVFFDPMTVAEYQANISEYKPREIPVILKPTTTEEVIRVVEIANRYHTPLYPISTGKNWGLGSRLPVVPECAIVDLGQLNSVVTVNEHFRYAIIEPGVTQKQLSDHLKAIKSSLILNVTGSAEDTSIVGNVLERGVGALDHRIQDLLGLEVILGNGQVVRTGFWHFHEESDHKNFIAYYSHGIGPDLNGLFAQSNMGIVTKIILRLSLYRRRKGIYFFFPEENLISTINEIRSLREERLIVGSHIVTEVKDPRTAVTMAPAQSTWFSSVMLNYSNALLEPAMEEVKDRLANIAIQIDSFDPNDWTSGIKNEYVQIMSQMVNGTPTNYSLETMARMTGHKLTNSNIDLNPEVLGFVCALLAIPFDGKYVVDIIDRVRHISQTVGLESYFNFVAISDTAMEGFFRVFFDRNDKDKIALAHRWNKLVYRDLETIGVYPYRMNVVQMLDVVERPHDSFWQTVGKLNNALDPNNIIAPGRYSLLW